MTENRPNFLPCMTFSDPNKKVLKDWVWKVHRGMFNKDHSIVTPSDMYIGFWTKAGTLYYATLINPKGVY